MTISQTLIDRFFENKCSPEEVATVLTYFKNNPAVMQDALKKAEWDAIMEDGSLPDKLSEAMLENIKARLFPAEDIKTRRVGSYYKWAAIAAAVILVFCIWVFQKSNAIRNNAVAQLHDSMRAPVVLANEPGEKWQIKSNTTKRPLKVLFQDGSRIALSPNSTIRYPDTFAKNKRDVFLEGEAFFEVEKDKHKPFTVFAGNLSTTALGTSFIVAAPKQKRNSVLIKLFTGKVVIRSTKQLPGWQEDQFLIPGQQLTYDETNGRVDASTFSLQNNKDVVDSKQENVLKGEVSFSHTVLFQVLDRLAELKDVEIKYSTKELKGMNFTGKINKEDDIVVVLKVIAQMNGLQIKQTADKSFVVTKSSN